MKFIRKAPLILGATIMLAMTSCSEKQWTAEGTIAGGEGKELILEAPNGTGGWYPIDTVEIGRNGSFSVSAKPAGHPEVFRLTLGGESIYFPIDSLDNIEITADTASFGSAYKLTGSESADKMQEVNDLIAKVVASQGEKSVSYDPTLKRALSELILRDPSGITAYYTIFRRVGNTLIFDPSEKSDLRIIGAVANAFTSKRPADPRTAMLQNLYISNKRAQNPVAASDTIVAQEISLPEIELLDRSGKSRSLTAEASKGNVVILSFTAYAAQGSPALNLELAKIYDAHKSQGIQIYQVSFDEDEFQWKQAAKNIPWIAVYNSPKDGADVLLKYNVTDLPALFVINRKGELVERIDNINRLESAVARYL